MEEFVKLINEYGPGVCILGFTCFLIYYIVKSSIEAKNKEKETTAQRVHEEKIEKLRNERETERNDREDKRYDKLCCGIEKLSDSIKKTEHTKEEQDKDVMIDNFIQNELDEVVRFGASRAFYFVFHNGGKDILGRGMLKMTLQIESIASGEKYNQANWQAIPRSVMPTLYQKLNENGEYYIENVDSLEDSDLKTYAVLKEDRAASAVFRAIKEENGLIVGFVGAEAKDKNVDFKEFKKIVSKKTDRISGALLALDMEIK